MAARDDMLSGSEKSSLIAEASSRLSAFAKSPPSPEYQALLLKLIVEGAVKLDEPEVTVRCRKEDEGVVKSWCVRGGVVVVVVVVVVVFVGLAAQVFEVGCADGWK